MDSRWYCLRDVVGGSVSLAQRTFTKSSSLSRWAYLNGVELDFSRLVSLQTTLSSRPSTPGFGLNGLNESWFLPLEDAREKIEGWLALPQRTSSQRPGEPRPGDLCPSGHSRGSMTHKTNITTGTKNGQDQATQLQKRRARLAHRLAENLCRTSTQL